MYNNKIINALYIFMDIHGVKKMTGSIDSRRYLAPLPMAGEITINKKLIDD